MGRIDNKRCVFADSISLAFDDRFAIGFSHTNTVCFTASSRFTGCIPFRDSVSGAVANGVAETSRVASSVPFPVRGLVKPGVSLDVRCFADSNARGAEPAKKTTATATA